jgi:hemerythrin-like domain-containing protein
VRCVAIGVHIGIGPVAAGGHRAISYMAWLGLPTSAPREPPKNHPTAGVMRLWRNTTFIHYCTNQGNIMPTATSTIKTSSSKAPAHKEATAILRADHKLVSDLFEQYEKSRSPEKKKELVAQICKELTIHAQVEEEIFYPAVQAALKDHELIPEATVEHATLKDLIAQVEGLEPDGEMFDAKIKVMSEYVKHHVKEEQNEIFPKARATSLDMTELGDQITARKQELMGAM